MLPQSRLVVVLMILGVIAGSLPAPQVNAQSQRDEEEAAEQAIHLSELESNGRASSLYRLMHSDSKAVSPKAAVVGWYENDFFPLDPQPIIEILDVRFITWTWEVTGGRYRQTAEVDFIQPFGTGSDVSYVEETVRLVEEDGEWRWSFGRSREFVDTQIARFVDDSESLQDAGDEDNERSSSDDGLPGSTRDCTLVELYPGYPGYRGNITGVMPHWGGIGDYLCLQELEESDPSFNRSREDRANRRAARALAINGDFEDWTWENWIWIEIERGMEPQCYTCLMLDTSASPYNPEIRPEPGDPRLAVGFLGDTFAIRAILEQLFESAPRVSNVFPDDYALRARAYLSLGPTANAPELFDAMTNILEETFQPGGGYYTVGQIHEVLTTSGGYIPTDASMHPSDQVVVAYETLVLVYSSMMSWSQEQLDIQFWEAVDGWRYAGHPGRLADFLDESWEM
jgi:hypothetical protein